MSGKQKNEVGRPLLSEEEKRKSRLTIGMTNAEHARFTGFARNNGLKLAELFRIATNEFIKRREQG